MPKAVTGAAMIAGAAVLDVATGGAAAPLTTAMLMSGISMEAGAIAHALGSSTGIGTTTRQAAAPRQCILGEYRVGAVNTFRSTTGSSHDQYNFVDTLAGHSIDSVVNMYLDGRQIYWQGSGGGWCVRNGVGFGGVADGNDHVGPGGQKYNFGGTGHSGIYAEARFGDHSATSAGPSYPPGTPGYISGLTANDPSWGPSGSESPLQLGCALVYFKAEYDQTLFPQEPARRYTVRGVNTVFDPRDGTYKWTNNWALLVAWLLTNPEFGLGEDMAKVNQAQLIAAANICDEQVPLAAGGTESRYTLNWVFDTSMSAGDVLDKVMSAAGGRLVWAGGEWYIYPAYWQGPAFEFETAQLTGPVQWKPYLSLSKRCNRVQGTYMAPNVPYNDAGNLYDSNGWWNGTILNQWPFAWHPTSYPTYACDPLHGYAEDGYLEADSNSLGAWASGTAYEAGDVVTYAGVLYKSLIDANIGSEPDTHSWAGGGPAGAWSSGTAYNAGDAAVYSGQLYVSLVGSNTGNEPDSSSADWAAVQWVAWQNMLPLQLDLPHVVSITQAQRVAKIALMRNRQEGRGTLPLHLTCWQAQPLDVIQFTHPTLNWGDKLLEIATTRLGAQPDAHDEKSQCVRFEADVQETAPEVYEWSTSEELTPYDVPANPATPPLTPDAPTGLTLTSDSTTGVTGLDGIFQPRILATWTAPTDVLTQIVQIQYQLAGAATWTDVGSVDGGTTSSYISGVVAGQTYNVRIRSVRANGAVSAWLEADGCAVPSTMSSIATGALPVATGSSGGIISGVGSGITISDGVISADAIPVPGVVAGGFDGGSSAPVTGTKRAVQVPYAGTITGWSLWGNASGSAAIDIRTSTFAGYPATASIVASAPPSLSSQQSASSTTLTGWSTTVAAGTMVEVALSSISGLTWLYFEIQIQRT